MLLVASMYVFFFDHFNKCFGDFVKIFRPISHEHLLLARVGVLPQQSTTTIVVKTFTTHRNIHLHQQICSIHQMAHTAHVVNNVLLVIRLCGAQHLTMLPLECRRPPVHTNGRHSWKIYIKSIQNITRSSIS